MLLYIRGGKTMKLRELRVLNNLTQQELANKIGITQFTYCNYEKEKTQPTIDLLIKIANYFNVSLDYLCCNEQATKNIVYLDNLSKEQNEAINLIKNNNVTSYDIELLQEILKLSIFEKGTLIGRLEAMKENNERLGKLK